MAKMAGGEEEKEDKEEYGDYVSLNLTAPTDQKGYRILN